MLLRDLNANVIKERGSETVSNYELASRNERAEISSMWTVNDLVIKNTAFLEYLIRFWTWAIPIGKARPTK